MKPLTADDPETKSPDLVAANIERLKELFPDAVTEGKLDFDVLRQLLGGAVDEREEKYGLNWHGKRRARQIALTPSTGTLRPAPEDSVDWDTTQNLMIEGDNLEVLKLLQKSYAGRVKLIYIDPPYNTGKDFVYPDNFQDNIRNYLELTGQVDSEGNKIASNTESSGRFHTDWLNMMYPRLRLARSLLKPDGLICISIDDFERDDLRKVCDEIFGEENFVESIVWKKRYGGGAKEKHLVSVHEYILVYARDLSEIGELFVPQSKESIERYYTKRDANYDKRGPYRTHPLEATKSMGDRPNLVFPIPGPDGDVMPKRQWLWSRDRVTAALSANEIEFLKDRDGNWTAHSKQYLKDEDGEIRQSKVFSVIDNVYSQHGTNELIELFGDARVFPFPKPTGLVRPLLEFGAADQDAIVMDFFAGSGTTAHSLMSLNATDSGSRRFLLVQLPEPIEPEANPAAADFCDKLGKPRNIAELTKERLRRAATKVKQEAPMLAGDLGFRVFTLDSSNINAWEPDRHDLPKTLQESVHHLKTDRTEQDILFELLQKLGLDLTVPIEDKAIVGKTVHSIGAGALMACLADKIDGAEVEPLALGIVAWHKELDPAGETMVVFRDSAFADDVAKTNLTAILQQNGLENVRSL
jgi:adenine-specific DNA-methyltransferase